MWKDLTLQQKAEIMKMSVANGVTDINDIKRLYDSSVGHRFDDGGPYSDEFMKNYGYSWVPANRILVSDPYFKEIQKHNPNGTYAVDKNGYYVPASRIKQEWEEYNSGQAINGPETAIPLNEVVHTFDNKDKQDIRVAKRLWGDARKLAYKNMSNSVGDTYYSGHSYMNQLISPNEIIRRLDTINQHSTYPKLYLRTVDNDVVARHDKERWTMPDGRLRAHFDQDNFFPWDKSGNIYVDAGGKDFLSQYIAELAHNYQYTSRDINHPLLIGEHYTGLDYDDVAYSTPKYNEYRAHSVIQPTLLNYISNIDVFGGETNPYYFNEAIEDIKKDLLDVDKKKALGGHLFNKGGSKNKNKGTRGVNYHTNEAQSFVDELVAAGVRPVDAYAAAGNVFVESRFNHEASNNINGGHWGLVQNDTNIKRHIIKYYGDYSRNSQMQFLKDGLTGQIKGAKNARWLQQRFDDYRRHAAGVKDASIAAKYFHDDYEKSRNEMVADRMKAASFYQTGIAANPTVAAYHKMYGKPDLSISNDILYNPAQELKWTNITPTIQQTPWYNNVSSNLAMNDFTPQVKPITPMPIEERFPMEELPDIAPLLSYLPDQQLSTPSKTVIPSYQPVDLNFNSPYLLFSSKI